jgi:hypothetical protein
MTVEPPIATARTQTRWAPCTAHWDTFNDYMPLTSRQTILLLRLFNPLLDKNVAQSSHIRRLKGSLEYDSRRLIMHNRVTREHLVHSLTAQSTPDIPRPTKKKMWHFNMALEHSNELSADYIRLINLVAPCVVPYACYPRFPTPSPIPWLLVTRAPHLRGACSSSAFPSHHFRTRLCIPGPCSALLRGTLVTCHAAADARRR